MTHPDQYYIDIIRKSGKSAFEWAKQAIDDQWQDISTDPKDGGFEKRCFGNELYQIRS